VTVSELPVSMFSESEIRQRAKERLRFPAGSHDGDYIRNPDFKDWVVSNATKDAAVLMPLVQRENQMNVLLTKRADKLASHSGQVAFPGGKIDATDNSPEDAALREAEEEVGLPRNRAEVLGRLPDYYTGSGYKIAPVLALMDPGVKISANPEEVDYSFEVPLSFLMNPDNHLEGSREFEGKRRYFLEIRYGEH